MSGSLQGPNVAIQTAKMNRFTPVFTGDSLNGSERDKRLRPERPKKENPDFDYEFPENLVWVNKEQMPFPLSNQEAVRIEKLQERPISQVMATLGHV